MKPLCSAPSILPAPRMSRSCMAMWMPLPRSEKFSMACRRRLASGVSEDKGGAKQVAESLFVAAPHTAAHLVQVAQAEVLRLVDDDGIGVRYVDAALDDGGGEQHVVIVVDEIEDNLLQFGRLHLSVTDTDTAVGNVALYHGLQLRTDWRYGCSQRTPARCGSSRS